jgi:hypothetical protein
MPTTMEIATPSPVFHLLGFKLGVREYLGVGRQDFTQPRRNLSGIRVGIEPDETEVDGRERAVSKHAHEVEVAGEHDPKTQESRSNRIAASDRHCALCDLDQPSACLRAVNRKRGGVDQYGIGTLYHLALALDVILLENLVIGIERHHEHVASQPALHVQPRRFRLIERYR